MKTDFIRNLRGFWVLSIIFAVVISLFCGCSTENEEGGNIPERSQWYSQRAGIATPCQNRDVMFFLNSDKQSSTLMSYVSDADTDQLLGGATLIVRGRAEGFDYVKLHDPNTGADTLFTDYYFDVYETFCGKVISDGDLIRIRVPGGEDETSVAFNEDFSLVCGYEYILFLYNYDSGGGGGTLAEDPACYYPLSGPFVADDAPEGETAAQFISVNDYALTPLNYEEFKEKTEKYNEEHPDVVNKAVQEDAMWQSRIDSGEITQEEYETYKNTYATVSDWKPEVYDGPSIPESQDTPVYGSNKAETDWYSERSGETVSVSGLDQIGLARMRKPVKSEAGTGVAMTIEELTVYSTLAVRGRVVGFDYIKVQTPETVPDLDDGVRIFTEYYVEILDTLRGEGTPGDVVTVRVSGGEDDDAVYLSSGISLEVGRQYLMFLTQTSGCYGQFGYNTQDIYYYEPVFGGSGIFVPSAETVQDEAGQDVPEIFSPTYAYVLGTEGYGPVDYLDLKAELSALNEKLPVDAGKMTEFVSQYLADSYAEGHLDENIYNTRTTQFGTKMDWQLEV